MRRRFANGPGRAEEWGGCSSIFLPDTEVKERAPSFDRPTRLHILKGASTGTHRTQQDQDIMPKTPSTATVEVAAPSRTRSPQTEPSRRTGPSTRQLLTGVRDARGDFSVAARDEKVVVARWPSRSTRSSSQRGHGPASSSG